MLLKNISSKTAKFDDPLGIISPIFLPLKLLFKKFAN